MPDTTIKRQIVQQGLDARAAQRAEAAEDAAHEAAERALLAVVNRNAEASRNGNEAVETGQDTLLWEGERQRRRNKNWNRFMERTFGSLLIPSCLVASTVYFKLPVAITIGAWIATGAYITANSVAYALRNRTTREALAEAWKRIVKKAHVINFAINRKGE